MEQQLMPCPHCGSANFSSHSGCYQCMRILKSVASPQSLYPRQPVPQQPPTPPPVSARSQKMAFILSMFLGHLGIDRFYIGKIGTGLLKLLTFLGIPLYLLGIFYPLVSMHRSEFMILLLLPTMANTIWAWIDWFHLGTRLVKDRKGRPLARAKVVGRPRKEQALAFRLCCFVGSLGISDFYLGRFVRSLARLAVTFGPLFLLFKFKPDFDARATKAFVGVWMLANGIWNTVDLAQIGMGIALDGKGNSLIPPAA